MITLKSLLTEGKLNEDIKRDIDKFIAKLNKQFPDQEYTVSSVGGKYVRITHKNRKGGQESAWGFIALVDNPSKGFQKGDLLKAAGYNTPDKNARGNILNGTAKYDKYSPAYLREELINEAFNVRDLPTWLFDDPVDFEDWYEDGMELANGKGKLAPFSSSDEKKLFQLVGIWQDAEGDYQYGRGDYGTGKTTGARSVSYTAQDDIKKFLTQKGKIINEPKTYKKGDKLKIKLPNGKKIDVVFDSYSRTKGVALGKFKDNSGEYDTKPFNLDTVVESVNEGNWSKIMTGVKKGSQSGPWTIVIIQNKKVIHQEPVKYRDAIPAHYESVKKQFRNASLAIEDKTGQIVYSEKI